MGSGKSVVGALVAKRTRAPFHDLDKLIEDKAAMPISEIFATGGEAAFRALETSLLPNALERGAVVALGGGSLMHDANWELVTGKATTIYLEVPFETMWQRIRKLTGRPLAAGRSREEVESLFERRRPRYEQASHRVDGDRPPAAVADEVIKIWSA
ncbi:MAG: shikimate kinase [Candidatus Dormibacteraeota bacterium]|nr:shikimate kinase [Candidatus Dormibacteraeota bacterium]